MNTQSKNRLTQQLRLFSKARELLKRDVSGDTLAYLFLLHLISGISQSSKGGIRRSDFSAIDFTPYKREIDNANHVLDAFFQNENASVMGKARIRLFCHEMKRENYSLAGRIMGLE